MAIFTKPTTLLNKKLFANPQNFARWDDNAGCGTVKTVLSGSRKEKKALKASRVKLDDHPFYAYSVAESMKGMKLLSHNCFSNWQFNLGSKCAN